MIYREALFMDKKTLQQTAKEFIDEANSLAETIRVAKVLNLNVMNSSATQEKIYNDIAFVAAQVCGMEAGIITFIDDKVAFIKANSNGACGPEPRENAFCNIAIQTPDTPLIVEDARKDDRFVKNHKVINGDVIFYAGVPMVCQGQPLGALCVIDKKPGTITDAQLESLKRLASIISEVVLEKK